MEKRKQLSPPKRLYTVPTPPLPPLSPLYPLPPPLPNYCCGNYEKLKIEKFSQWKSALQQFLQPQNIDERIINIKLYWYKIKSSVASFHSLKETLENERPTLHYILIQGYNRHHLFTQEEDKITVIFKKKKRKKVIVICYRRMLHSIQQIWKKYCGTHATKYQSIIIFRNSFKHKKSMYIPWTFRYTRIIIY